MKFIVIGLSNSAILTSMAYSMALQASDRVMVIRSLHTTPIDHVVAQAHTSRPFEQREKALLAPPTILNSKVDREQSRFLPPSPKHVRRALPKHRVIVGSNNSNCYGGTDFFWRHIKATY